MSDKNGAAQTKPNPDALRAEIKQTRAELVETVQVLAARADVKARTREQVELTRQRLRAQAVQAATRVREAAGNAGGRVRTVAGQAGGRVRTVAGQAGSAAQSMSTREPVRFAMPLVAAGVAALAGVILIVQGRRR